MPEPIVPGALRRPRSEELRPAPALSLAELGAGNEARLIACELDPGETCLLAAMGLATGSRLVVRVAGDPCVIEVRTTRIGLARTVAERLRVVIDRGDTSRV